MSALAAAFRVMRTSASDRRGHRNLQADRDTVSTLSRYGETALRGAHAMAAPGGKADRRVMWHGWHIDHGALQGVTET
jgi:hypothetical protein